MAEFPLDIPIPNPNISMLDTKAHCKFANTDVTWLSFRTKEGVFRYCSYSDESTCNECRFNPMAIDFGAEEEEN